MRIDEIEFSIAHILIICTMLLVILNIKYRVYKNNYWHG